MAPVSGDPPPLLPRQFWRKTHLKRIAGRRIRDNSNGLYARTALFRVPRRGSYAWHLLALLWASGEAPHGEMKSGASSRSDVGKYLFQCFVSLSCFVLLWCGRDRRIFTVRLRGRVNEATQIGRNGRPIILWTRARLVAGRHSGSRRRILSGKRPLAREAMSQSAISRH